MTILYFILFLFSISSAHLSLDFLFPHAWSCVAALSSGKDKRLLMPMLMLMLMQMQNLQVRAAVVGVVGMRLSETGKDKSEWRGLRG